MANDHGEQIRIAQEMELQYPEVKTDYMYVDNAAMRMIQEPTFFDVMVTENTFGDILTDQGTFFLQAEMFEQHSYGKYLCQWLRKIHSLTDSGTLVFHVSRHHAFSMTSLSICWHCSLC